ncbi:phytoene desaturase family protein [Paenibacillus sp. GYB004]|uniref:phytoene desaturase family protein n=1 Tax=Paenibacillus sp. GYB004 TaxID=2994393 RepID=UPI002F964320
MNVGIVGGGIGGLTVALLLSQRGIAVTIYEKAGKLGGRLAFRRLEDGCRIDEGPTIVLLPEMLLSVLEEGGLDRSEVPLLECSPMYRIYYGDGTVLNKWRNTGRQLEELQSFAPGSERGFLKYMSDMNRAFSIGERQILNRRLLRKRHLLHSDTLRMLAAVKAYKSARSLAADYFTNDKLVDAFSLQTLYIGGSPSATPSLYSFVSYAEHAFGVWYMPGGYATLVEKLERVLRSRGVRIKLNCEVNRLEIGEGRCSGVKLSDGSVVPHDQVIFNGDFPHLSPLLPGGAKPSKRAAFVPSSGCLLLYATAAKRWTRLAGHQFFLPETPLSDHWRLLFEQRKVPANPSFYVFSPTALEPEAAPEGHSVLYFLVPVPTGSTMDWQKEKQAIVDYVLSETERRAAPGLTASIRHLVVKTPEDAEAEGLFGGGSFGIAPTWLQSGPFRPQQKPYPIEGLHALGASVHPGGGVPIVMHGAKLLCDQLMKERSRWNA